MKEIPLTRGLVAKVSDEDYERAMAYKWHVIWREDVRTFYAVRWGDGHKRVKLHRFIMNAPDNVLVDHCNHDGLDCQRENLRLCSNAQNTRNVRKHRDNHIGYKGVCQHYRKFVARIFVDGRSIYIGLFPTAECAAQAYDEKAREVFGEYACLNF